MKTLPVCVSVCELVCRRRIPEQAREKVRGSAEERGTAQQISQRGLRRGRLESRPLLSPGPWWCLRGHMDACLCAPSHQPILHPPPPPPPPPLHDRTVHVNESWPEWRGAHFCWWESAQSLLSLPPLTQHSKHLYCRSSALPILSLPF